MLPASRLNPSTIRCLLTSQNFSRAHKNSSISFGCCPILLHQSYSSNYDSRSTRKPFSRITEDLEKRNPTKWATPATAAQDFDLEKFAGSVGYVRGMTGGRVVMDALITHMMQYPNLLGKLNWPDLLRICKEKDRTIDDKNFGGVFLLACSNKDRSVPIAEEYMKWDKNPGISVLSTFIRILGKDDTRKINEPQIIDLYEKIKAKNRGIWDVTTGERVLQALARTSKWRDCLNIIEAMKVGGSPGSAAYGAVIAAAFQNKDFDLGWELLNIVKSKAHERGLIAYLQNCDKTEEQIVKLLDFMDLHGIFPSTALIEEIRKYFEKFLNYSAVETRILASRGTCTQCNSVLEKNELTAAEYKILTDAFMNKVMETTDVFLNTTPEELKEYITFVHKNAPFDFVLDGLNISHAVPKSSTRIQAQFLEQVVNTFYRQGKRILIIGRKHMNSWHPDIMGNIRKMSFMHLIENNSNDDPFIIYAAIKSGAQAKFISKDFMRNHTFRLQDPQLERLFKRWRLSHQLSFQTRPPRDFRTVPFTSLLPVPQKNPGTGVWHIPYDTDPLLSPYSIPSKWLCLTPKRTKPK